MTRRGFDSNRLDVAAFAAEAASLSGRWPVSGFERLAEVVVSGAAADATDASVVWQLRGEPRRLRDGRTQPCLHLTAHAQLALVCQRCLKPVNVPLDIDRQFLFVSGETQAAEADADCDDDVLALTRALNVRELVEDELLLGLPLVPRHEVCPEPLTAPAPDDETLDEPTNSFAALAALKQGAGFD